MLNNYKDSLIISSSLHFQKSILVGKENTEKPQSWETGEMADLTHCLNGQDLRSLIFWRQKGDGGLKKAWERSTWFFFDAVIPIGAVDFIMEAIDVDLSGHRKGWCVFHKHPWASLCYFFHTVAYIFSLQITPFGVNETLFNWTGSHTFCRQKACLNWCLDAQGEKECPWNEIVVVNIVWYDQNSQSSN